MFPPLTADMERRIDDAFKSTRPLAKLDGIQIQPSDIQKLLPKTWLNDEIINFYGSLIMHRSRTATATSPPLPKVYYFNSFFYPALEKNGWDGVKRWTRKFNLFHYDMVIFPINLNSTHWCCAIIDLKRHRVEYYDSLLGAPPPTYFSRVRQYLEQEYAHQHPGMHLTSHPGPPWDWTYCPRDIPAQLNGYDCGVFTCAYANWRAVGLDVHGGSFEQHQMTYLRRRMVWEICEGRLLT